MLLCEWKRLCDGKRASVVPLAGRAGPETGGAGRPGGRAGARARPHAGRFRPDGTALDTRLTQLLKAASTSLAAQALARSTRIFGFGRGERHGLRYLGRGAQARTGSFGERQPGRQSEDACETKASRHAQRAEPMRAVLSTPIVPAPGPVLPGACEPPAPTARPATRARGLSPSALAPTGTTGVSPLCAQPVIAAETTAAIRTMSLRARSMTRHAPQPACPQLALRALEVGGPARAVLEQFDKRRFLRAAAHRFLQTTAEVGLEDVRMDVALAAHRRGIAQHLRCRLYRAANVATSCGRRARCRQGGERTGAEQRTRPGSKVFAGEVVPGDGAQIRVDIRRLDRPRIALLVDVVKKLFAGKLLHVPHDARQPSVGERHFVRHAALAAELEAHPRARDAHLSLPQRREAE